MTEAQYARIRYGVFQPLFKVEMDVGTSKVNPENNAISTRESFLLYFYQNLYVKLKKRWKVDIPVIDFNLTRLHHCIVQVAAQRGQPQQQTMLNIDELVIALEFYLQIDGKSKMIELIFLSSLFSGHVLSKDMLIQ